MISGASDEELDIAIARANVLLELQPKIDELKKENQELKKQLEEKENQQKEFIECLENKLLIIDNILNTEIYESKIHYALIRKTAFEEILSKYNEIIGGKDE